jgi:hypothetical protein
MSGKRSTMSLAILCLVLLVAAVQVGFSATQSTGPGCINCVNTNGVWGCKLTQTNGGTDCTPIGSGCVISGSCIIPTPVPGDPVTPTTSTYLVALPDEMLQEIRDRSPRAAAALDLLRAMGPVHMPARVYQNPSRRGGPAIVHEIRVHRDPADGELTLTVRQAGGEERDAFRQLKITVSPQWESDKEWRLAPKLWRIED